MAHLRPVVEHDLRRLLQNLYGTTPTKIEVDKEFTLCKFTRVNLGSLGEAVVVEAQPGHGVPNAAMLNVYARTKSGYRRVIEGAGFGPYVIPREDAPPDLVFGWTSGVCTARYNRYHYANGEYTVNGCAQEDREHQPKSGELCAITSCEGPQKLPLFNPPPNKDTTEDVSQQNEQSCVPDPEIVPVRAMADSEKPAPYNQVQFVLAPRTQGRCQPTPLESGNWTTSDPVNTRIDSQGDATWIHATEKPALIRFTGTFHHHVFAAAYLACK
jgi:hypothetical protein